MEIPIEDTSEYIIETINEESPVILASDSEGYTEPVINQIEFPISYKDQEAYSLSASQNYKKDISQISIHKTKPSKFITPEHLHYNISESNTIVFYAPFFSPNFYFIHNNKEYSLEVDLPSFISTATNITSNAKILNVKTFFPNPKKYVLGFFLELSKFFLKIKVTHFKEDSDLPLEFKANFIFKENFPSSKMFFIKNKEELILPPQYKTYTVKDFSTNSEAKPKEQQEENFLFKEVTNICREGFIIILESEKMIKIFFLYKKVIYKIENTINTGETKTYLNNFVFNKQLNILFFYSEKEERLKLTHIKQISKQKPNKDNELQDLIEKYSKNNISVKGREIVEENIVEYKLISEDEKENGFVLPLTEDFEEQKIENFGFIEGDKIEEKNFMYFYTDKQKLYISKVLIKNKEASSNNEGTSKHFLGKEKIEKLKFFFKKLDDRKLDKNKLLAFSETKKLLTDVNKFKEEIVEKSNCEKLLTNFNCSLDKSISTINDFNKKLCAPSHDPDPSLIITKNYAKLTLLLHYRIQTSFYSSLLLNYNKLHNRYFPMVLNPPIHNSVNFTYKPSNSLEIPIQQRTPEKLYTLLSSYIKEFNNLQITAEPTSLTKTYFGQNISKPKIIETNTNPTTTKLSEEIKIDKPVKEKEKEVHNNSVRFYSNKNSEVNYSQGLNTNFSAFNNVNNTSFPGFTTTNNNNNNFENNNPFNNSSSNFGSGFGQDIKDKGNFSDFVFGSSDNQSNINMTSNSNDNNGNSNVFRIGESGGGGFMSGSFNGSGNGNSSESGGNGFNFDVGEFRK